MSKIQIALLAGAALIVTVGVVVRAKRISPLGWGWYGHVQTTGGLALRGYDPVAYHSQGATPGDSTFSLEWQGATYRFASAENRAAFEAAPERYVPEFGGFCSYASSKGFTATVDPTAFRIHGGRLYVFNDANMRDKWVAELSDGVIERAREHWIRSGRE